MGLLYSVCYYPLGNLVYVIEKIASCCAMAAVISCIVATLTIMLGLGVGLGYNYCFVDFKVHEVTTSTTNLPPSTDEVNQYLEQWTPDNADENRQDSKAVTVPVRPTMVIPLKDHEGLMLLISKIQEHKRNITLELIT